MNGVQSTSLSHSPVRAVCSNPHKVSESAVFSLVFTHARRQRRSDLRQSAPEGHAIRAMVRFWYRPLVHRNRFELETLKFRHGRRVEVDDFTDSAGKWVLRIGGTPVRSLGRALELRPGGRIRVLVWTRQDEYA